MLLSYFFSFLYIFILSIVICGWGNLANFQFKIKNFCISENVILGLFSLGAISLFFNFFISINYILNSSIIFLGVFLFFFFNKTKLKKSLISLLIITVISFITITNATIFLPDAAVYHLPYIGILNENKIIFGLNNINLRYGQISFFQYISAILNIDILGSVGILFPSIFLFSSLVFFFLKDIFEKQNIKSTKIISLFFLLIILVDMNRYSEFGNDEIGHMIFLYFNFYIIKELIFYLNKDKYFLNINKLIYVALFLFLTKLIYALVIVTLIYIFIVKKIKITELLNSKASLVSLMILIAWLTKNIIVSGCIIYPISFSCVSVEWSNNGFIPESILTEAWAKGYPDQNEITNYQDYISNHYIWLKTWLNNHGIFILKKLTVTLSILIFALIVVRSSKIIDKFETNITYGFLAINFLYILIWFLKFPVYRFGSGYLLLFFILLIIKFIQLPTSFDYKKIKIFLSILFVVIIIKNVNRIYKNHNIKNQNNNFFASLPDINKTSLSDIESQFTYSDTKYCYYSRNVCTSTPKKTLGKIGYKNVLNYKIFYSKNEKNWWYKVYNLD